jgi:hypothetical protein
MRTATRLSAGLLAALALSAAYHRQDQEKDQAPAPSTQALDKKIFDSLRDVINRGAEVYNEGDHGGCYRIFQGALWAVKPMLDHKPELQKMIGEKLTAAEGDPVVWRRAFTLRSALDKIRSELNPNPKKKDEKKADKDKGELKGKPKDQDDKKSDKDKDGQDKRQQPDSGKSEPDKDGKKKDADKGDEKKDKDKDKGKDKDKDKDKDEGKKDDADKDKNKKDDLESRLPKPDVERNG